MAKRSYNEFELGEILGTGTVGTVYRAHDRVKDREVAVKVLLPQLTKEKHIAARFEREMLVLDKLNHPNIVEYYGGGIHEGRMFYALELVEGGTLKQIIQARGALSWQEVTRYGFQVCSALQHAHNHGIVHRDLKPSNLFLSYEGELKLGDFGVALDTGESDLTADGLTVGSYMYMSPEQIRGESIVSNLTDLYALGCLLYEMLTGTPPFTGSNFAQIFDQHLNQEPADLAEHCAECPEPLRLAVMQLLQKNPQDRPFNARAIQGILSELRYDFELGDARDMSDDDKKRLRQELLLDAQLARGNHRDVSGKTIAIGLLILVGICALAMYLQSR